MAGRAKSPLDKILPRAVFLALERAGSGTSTTKVFVAYPTQGMKRAERMGLIECYDQHDLGLCAYRRTAKGEAKYVEYERARKSWIK